MSNLCASLPSRRSIAKHRCAGAANGGDAAPAAPVCVIAPGEPPAGSSTRSSAILTIMHGPRWRRVRLHSNAESPAPAWWREWKTCAANRIQCCASHHRARTGAPPTHQAAKNARMLSAQQASRRSSAATAVLALPMAVTRLLRLRVAPLGQESHQTAEARAARVLDHYVEAPPFLPPARKVHTTRWRAQLHSCSFIADFGATGWGFPHCLVRLYH